MVSLVIGKTRIPDIGLVIFDKDGTLMDLHRYWVPVTRLRAEAIAARLSLQTGDVDQLISVMGVDLAKSRVKASGPVGTRKREVVMRSAEDYLLSRGFDNPHDPCSAAFEDVDRLSQTMADELIHPLPGTERVLALLHENGCRIAIATSDRTDRATRALEHLALLQYIDLIIGADQTAVPKPDPETVTIIRKTIRVDLQNTVVVGDTEVDIDLGIRAGVKACIGVASGSAPREVLMGKTPYVLDNVGQIGVELP